MNIREKLFGGRCATCPDRSIASCVLSQLALGEEYRPDNCRGSTVARGNRSAVVDAVGYLVGDNAGFIGSVGSLKSVCAQNTAANPEGPQELPPIGLPPQ